jgi:hypothetical protein
LGAEKELVKNAIAKRWWCGFLDRERGIGLIF